MFLDLRLALRQFRTAPAFTATVILVLALGIGANAALYSVFDALLLRPFPIPDLERLVVMIPRIRGEPYLSNPAEARMWKNSQLHDGWGAAFVGSAVLTEQESARHVFYAAADTGYLDLLGAQPSLGRRFTADECRQDAPLLLLSHALWQSMGTDPAVIGRAVQLDGRLRTIIGVMAPGFDAPQRTEAYIPYALPGPGHPDYTVRGVLVVGRMKPGVTLAQSAAEMAPLAADLGQAVPQQRGWTVEPLPLRRQLALDLHNTLRQRLIFLAGATLALLVLTCLNVGNMMLARTLARSREFAICTALGCSAWRLLRRVTLESVVLAAAGAAVGVPLAALLSPLLLASNPVDILAMSDSFTIDPLNPRVLVATLIVTLCAALLAAVPAWRFALRADVSTALQASGGRGGTAASGAWREILLVAQVALCAALLVGAGLLARGFLRLTQTPLGYDPNGVSSVRVLLPRGAYPDQAARFRYLEQAIAALRALPEVASATATTTTPLHLEGWGASVVAENGAATAEQPMQTQHRLVGPHYFETLRARLIAGRFLTPADRAGAPSVVVVTESFARQVWPDLDPIGQRVRRNHQPNGWMTVVGVIENTKEDRTTGMTGTHRVWYLPYAQSSFEDPVHLVVRTRRGEPLPFTVFQRVLSPLDPLVPLYEPADLGAEVQQFMNPQRFSALLMIAFAVLGTLIAAVGLFGVSHYFVSLRQREFGIRLALGASPAELQRMVLRLSARHAALGTVAGLGAALALSRMVEAHFVGTRANDPGVYAASLTIVLVTVCLASWIPSRRAAGVDPVIALRAE